MLIEEWDLGVSSCLRGGEWHRQMNVLSQTQLQELTHEQTYTPQNKHELTATSSRLHPSHRKLEGRTHTLFWVIKPSATSNYLKRQQCCWSNLQQNFQHFLKRLALFCMFYHPWGFQESSLATFIYTLFIFTLKHIFTIILKIFWDYTCIITCTRKFMHNIFTLNFYFYL